jgi:hypothetical protein
MMRALGRGRLVLGTGLFALLLLVVVGVGSASADVQPFEVSEYRQEFEVPKQQAEETLEVQAAGAESGIVEDLEESLGGRYAGVWFDNGAGEFVVPLVDESDRPKVVDALRPEGLENDFRTAPADSTWTELEAAHAGLDDALSGAIEQGLVQTVADPRANSVVVREAAGASGRDRIRIERAAEEQSVDVDVRDQGARSLLVTPRACFDDGAGRFCGSPMRGGVGIWASGTVACCPEAQCTAGFKAIGKSNGERYVLTAGHCAEAVGNWTSLSTDEPVPLPHYLGYVEQYNNATSDYAKIRVSGSGTFWDKPSWPSMVAYWGEDQEHPINSESYSFMGQQVCHSGANSGTSCGIVTAQDMTVHQPGGDSFHQTEFQTVCTKGGDSGGPVFAANTALGIMTGNNKEVEGQNPPYCGEKGYYTEITEATDALNVSVGPRTTQTTVDSVAPLNGNPGWVTIKGQVHAPDKTTINNKIVKIKMSRWSVANNNWELKATLETTVNNNTFEISNWNGVSTGAWIARAVFPTQGTYLESMSDDTTEGNFEIKDGYRLVAKHSGKCLDVTGRSYENGALMEQWECLDPKTAQGQIFTLVPQGEYFQLVARNSGRCVDVTGSSQSDGVQLQQYTCQGASQANQLWKLTNVETSGGVEYFKLTAKHSGKCMDVAGGGTANGAKVQQWTCNGTNQQKWSFQSVESPPPATETTASVPPGEVFNGQPGYVTVNGKVQAGAYPVAGKYVNVNYSRETSPGVWTYISTTHPTLNSEGRYEYANWGVSVGNWRVRTVFPKGESLEESVSGYQYFTIKSGYRFVWRHSGKCMSLSGNKAANGTAIIQWECSAFPSPGDGQVFTLVPMGGGYNEVKINSTGKCVDVTGAGTADAVPLQEWDCLGANQANQLWKVVEVSGQPGWFGLVAKHSGKCAEVAGASIANGALFRQWYCNWGGHQQFAFQAIN